ncbi:hypothetical protein ABN214_15905 [Proteus terrae]|uniref:hypothetical protein n=1 Tax=Proteus terrae TaxID=1574161 RepID=UPI0032DB5193
MTNERMAEVRALLSTRFFIYNYNLKGSLFDNDNKDDPRWNSACKDVNNFVATWLDANNRDENEFNKQFGKALLCRVHVIRDNKGGAKHIFTVTSAGIIWQTTPCLEMLKSGTDGFAALKDIVKRRLNEMFYN